ncbi:MAG TPA: hypothetical protein VD816_17680, partial [Ohtaekwangia sp.]|nr:hypothetical protein [Ohtaekwangia sp.]
AGNILNITDGTSADLNALAATGQVAGPLNNLVIQPDAISSSHIVDGTVATADLANSAVDGTKLAGDAVTSGHIDDGTIATGDLASGGNDKVLTTDGSGAVTWADRVTFTDDNQDLTLAAGNILNITDGTSADLNALAATGQVAGPLNNLVIQLDAVSSSQIVDGTVATADLANGAVDGTKLAADAVTSAHIVDGTITSPDIQDNTIASNDILDESLTSADILNETIASADIANGTVATVDLADKAVTTGKIQQGTSNQILATNPGGTDAVWIDPASLPSTGDVTGTLGATTVARIQGRNVTNTAPNVGDALIWNGTAWVPSVVTVSPTVQYSSIDPSDFHGLEPDGGNNQTLTGLYEDNDGIFVAANGNARKIMAPINLPHGATIQAITAYYEYTTILGLLPMSITVYRKPLAGGANQQLATISPLLSIGISSTAVNITAPAANLIVDNTAFSYRVMVTFSTLGDVNTDQAATERLYGLRIQYLK